MSSRIEQIIEEIEEYVESCKYQPLSTTKIVVNKEELEELLRELRMKTPDEIKRYQKIISNKYAILADAQANEIVNSANQQAQAIIDSATADANNLRLSAISYTDEMMANLEQLIHGTMENANARYNELAQTYNAFAQSLQSAADVVSENRSELAPQLNNPIPKQTEEEPEENLDMDDLDDELEEDDE